MIGQFSKHLVSLTLLLPALVAGSAAAEWDSSARLDLGARYFFDAPRWPGQDGTRLQLSIAGSAEFRYRGESSRASIIPYLRYDAIDEERSLADLPEAYWASEQRDFELLLGANTVFWGVTESVHLVDIINQTDLAADIDGEDKLGQPMINLALPRDWGQVDLFLMPYFRERIYAGVDGRLRTSLPVDTDSAEYESSAGDEHIDVALRYSHFIGDIDLGLSFFSGTSREPRLILNDDADALLPVYDLIDQLGLDLQYTRDAWLWKLETIARQTPNDRFAATVGGFEYTDYQLAGSNTDLGLLIELQYDGRDESEPVTLADNDVFVGMRLALNDIQDSALLAGIGYDVKTYETYLNIEADRRLGEDFFVELEARFFDNAKSGDFSYAIAQDDYIQLQLSRYF